MKFDSQMKIAQPTDYPVINIAIDTINKQKQALIFVNTKRSAEKTAEDIAKHIKTTNTKLTKLADGILKAISKPTKQCLRLAKCVKKGTAFHHAGLTAKQRDIIEEAFRSGELKIIACTPSLAMGVDLPAYRAITKDLKRYTHQGLKYVPVLEYMQMSGRAGRPKYEKIGEAVAIASTEHERKEIIKRYINGYPEDIYSKLAVEPVLRTYVLSLIATGVVSTKKEMLNFFSRTFWAHQFKDMEHIKLILEKVIHMLEDFEFIKKGSEDFTSADSLVTSDNNNSDNNNSNNNNSDNNNSDNNNSDNNNSDNFDNNKEGNNAATNSINIESFESYRATTLGKRIAELYLDPLTAHHIIEAIKCAASKPYSIKPISFLQIISHTLEMRPLLRVKTREYEDIQSSIIEWQDHLLENEPDIYGSEYGDYINSVKTALFMLDWIEECNEEYLLEKYDIRPGEIRVKLEIADWLLYSTEELTRILQFQSLLREIKKLRFRLKYGVHEELLPLLKLKDIGRVRARKLFNNKIRNLGDVKRADVTLLAQLIGKAIALNIKKQTGQEILTEKIQVPEGKQKGQTSLKKYH
ncbi:hypothetical protein DRJ17_00380 [Candidatus Woesearchaeota archaeon]|nr:MAG: hypothetical protein DRJ17_00380 [Candidatus Woesearchaeota archaeon]